MRNKKKMIILGSVSLALIVVVASVTVLLVHKNSNGKVTIEARENINRNEIRTDYGSDFDEFANTSGARTNREAVALDTEDSDNIEDLENADEIHSRIKEEYEKNKSGIIYGEEGAGYETVTDLEVVQPGDSDSEVDHTDENDSSETGEDADASEISVPVFGTKGYAENEVLCDVPSMEEAESIASQISGTLLSWDDGVATIQIDEPVDVFLEKLEQQGSSLRLYRHYYL